MWSHPSTRTLPRWLWFMKFTILVDPSLVIITIYRYLVCLIYEFELRRFFKKYINFFMKFTISCLLTLKMLHTKFG